MAMGGKTRRRQNQSPATAHQQLNSSDSQHVQSHLTSAFDRGQAITYAITDEDEGSQALASTFPQSGLRTNAALNLAVLQRHNASIISVLSIAPYSVIYTFSAANATWEKSGIEGTLFICQLAPSDDQAYERFEVFVLNRRGLENFELELCMLGDVELMDDFIVLQKSTESNGPSPQTASIYALWIFAEPPPSSTADARKINTQIIQDCARRAEESRATFDHSILASIRDQGQRQLTHHLPSQGENRQPHLKSAYGGTEMSRQLSLRELFGQQGFHRDPSRQVPALHNKAGSQSYDVLDDLFLKVKQGNPPNA